MATEIKVAIWNQAPFQASIFRGIEGLNKHLKSRDIPISFEPILVGSKKPAKADIFILDGGEDVDPGRYNRKNEYSYFSKARDEAEFRLTKYYSHAGARLSGICRGHQLLNVYYGGTLWQDIYRSGLIKSKEPHSSGHKVFLKGIRKKKSILPNFTGDGLFTVSSLHHQAIADLGQDLHTTLIWKQRENKSGSHYTMHLIEGIENMNGTIRGLQCHPEFRGYPKDGVLFAYLMHVDAFTRDFVTIDVEQLKKRYGKKDFSKHYPEISSLPTPESSRGLRNSSGRGSSSFAERYGRD